MFKGKVTIYKTDPRTWKVYQIEKEFDDPKEYEEFLKSNKDLIDDFMKDFNEFGSFWPRLTLREWSDLERWIEDLIWRRFWLGYELESVKSSGKETKELPVDLNKYEQELKRLEEEKKRLETKKKELQKALDKLRDYKKQFEKAGRTDLVEQIEKDIEKVEEELKNLENKNK